MTRRILLGTVLNSRLGKLTSTALALLMLVTFFWGCNRSEDEIKVYRLAKPSGESEPPEKDTIASTNAPVKSTLERVPAATGDVPVPPNWEPRPLSEMRKASFLVKGENGAVADAPFLGSLQIGTRQSTITSSSAGS